MVSLSDYDDGRAALVLAELDYKELARYADFRQGLIALIHGLSLDDARSLGWEILPESSDS